MLYIAAIVSGALMILKLLGILAAVSWWLVAAPVLIVVGIQLVILVLFMLVAAFRA